ncbi:hypothetical protein [Parasitella parasitica]|uniref:Uncharacterized protein n=1 Tax=Parasitella parasitica TaxID=35722 RepID=A0A0B7N8B9_9FUNG|nr:hypothetical protein [Parasitella parasitica]
MKAQINHAQTNKHIGKISNLLDVSPIAKSQQWETNVTWSYLSILDDNCDWDDDTENAEEDLLDEENDNEEEEEEDDEIDGEEK